MTFRSHSLDLTKQLDNQTKKSEGVFFTPQAIRSKLISSLKPYLNKRRRYKILDPACGSAEFLLDLQTDGEIKVNQLLGFETNKTVYDKTVDYLADHLPAVNQPTIELIQADFCQQPWSGQIIIGNPPFYVTKKEQVPPEYRSLMVCRPNIFLVFLLRSIELLENNGFLAFVLPTSFLNSAYYASVRTWIIKNYTIHELIDFTENQAFLDTAQDTFGIIIQKKKDLTGQNNLWSVPMGRFGIPMFSLKTNQLRCLTEGQETLNSLGYQVKTGPIVWNEHKSDLGIELLDGYLTLVYSSNIINGNFQAVEFTNHQKGQYIQAPESNAEKDGIIVVNRGNGNSKYRFHWAYLDESVVGSKYVVENHLNMILPTDHVQCDLSAIQKSFEDPRTTEFLAIFCGNHGFSKTELQYYLPIYLTSNNDQISNPLEDFPQIPTLNLT